MFVHIDRFLKLSELDKAELKLIDRVIDAADRLYPITDSTILGMCGPHRWVVGVRVVRGKPLHMEFVANVPGEAAEAPFYSPTPFPITDDLFTEQGAFTQSVLDLVHERFKSFVKEILNN